MILLGSKHSRVQQTEQAESVPNVQRQGSSLLLCGTGHSWHFSLILAERKDEEHSAPVPEEHSMQCSLFFPERSNLPGTWRHIEGGVETRRNVEDGGLEGDGETWRVVGARGRIWGVMEEHGRMRGDMQRHSRMYIWRDMEGHRGV